MLRLFPKKDFRKTCAGNFAKALYVLSIVPKFINVFGKFIARLLNDESSRNLLFKIILDTCFFALKDEITLKLYKYLKRYTT